METTQIEIWVILDENGDYVATHNLDQLGQVYEENIGPDDSLARRKIKITLTVPLPQAVELTGTVPAESTEGITLNVQ